MRPRVMLVNHAYAAPENRKTLVHLQREVELCAVAPTHLPAAALGVLSTRVDVPRPGVPLILKPALYLRHKLVLSPFVGEIAAFRPDIVHVETAPWMPLALQTALFARVAAPDARLMLTLRKNTHLPRSVLDDAAKRALVRAMDRRVAGYVAESRLAAELWEAWFGIHPGRIHTCVQLGVDVELFCPVDAPPAGLVVGYAGRLEAQKGLPELVEAVATVVAAGVPVELRLLGEGSMSDELKRRATTSAWLTIEDAVRHRDVAAFLRSCSAFALLSRNEPDHQEHDAHALIEAMACGLPAIVTRSGIIPEVAHPTTAVFVRENHRRDVVAALHALADPAQRREMGWRARERATSCFSLGVLAKTRRAIYEEVLLDHTSH